MSKRKTAVLYTRVCSSLQTDVEYKTAIQHEQLTAYCEKNNIQILEAFADIGTVGTDFNRPGFKRLLAYAKSKHKSIDYVLFTSWEKFSRNAPNTFEMIAQLNNWNIKAQAISNEDINEIQMKFLFFGYDKTIKTKRR
ncbi:MAG: recombinase family protein [Bacteroidota bacterium]